MENSFSSVCDIALHRMAMKFVKTNENEKKNSDTVRIIETAEVQKRDSKAFAMINEQRR